ncbi:Signal transduction histidine kinase [Bosea sp. 62]|uniref:sensor histidine kinase n=1 Tax=unclassified Bosea (in: a-proteobacteria) TaxID=2653178 RepID=UPI001259744A|nr:MULTISPECIES: HAMP domain-containing sensor histidine kinase [unclassified Bosea (in: a-proteobacteria)]CAD5288597.1 Signal transduction histidine kinase [Bosea sp. 7B]CAD5300379.1 Signal transduction histidine kinase [Bosea sp. 21B]CAD5301001.1 Signal transduction histidine kinase [Bosea sp. 46]VVT62083.1 Signal transduction histidine kinase [Bosea sp. EC-HK365B]VXB62616.1 Signal transduction histidine kinase [Bosea sp. 125]
MTSLSRALTIRLSLLGIVLFTAFIGAVIAFALITEDPGVLRNDVTSQIIQQSVRAPSGNAVQVEKTAGLSRIERASSSLWYLVSDGRSLVEYAPELRPTLPIDIRLDGPTIAAQMRIGGENALAFDVIEKDGSRIIVATRGGQPGWDLILGYYLRAIAGSALAISVVFGLLIAGAIAMSVSYIGDRLRSAAEAAARIDPKAPRGLLPTEQIPIELMPLTTALNAALDKIAGNMEVQRRFMNNVAHELRTPLTVMRGRIDALPNDQMRLALTTDVSRLTTIVSSMLQLARLHSTELPFEAMQLNGIARAVLADLAPLILSNGADVALEEEGERRVLIEANEATVRAAIANLVDNALRHARAKSTILVKVIDGAVLEVADDGIGIEPSDRPQVTEAFNRMSPNSTGAGLGLTIVRDIMAAHGGTLTILGRPGGGTMVRLVFPPRASD